MIQHEGHKVRKGITRNEKQKKNIIVVWRVDLQIAGASAALLYALPAASPVTSLRRAGRAWRTGQPPGAGGRW